MGPSSKVNQHTGLHAIYQIGADGTQESRPTTKAHRKSSLMDDAMQTFLDLVIHGLVVSKMKAPGIAELWALQAYQPNHAKVEPLRRGSWGLFPCCAVEHGNW